MLRLGVDIGGTKVNLGLLDEDRRVVCRRTARLPGGQDCRGVLSFVEGQLAAMRTENGISLTQIASCGMGVPGTVSSDGTVAVKVPNLGWEQEPCQAVFEELTGIPTRLVQDSRAAALGEYLAGAGQGRRLLVCVTLGTGIGTGIIFNGRIFPGALGTAGELGHIPVVENGRPCGCGQQGCLENYAAGKGLALTANERMPRLGGVLRAEDVFRLAAEGDMAAAGILDEAVTLLGRTMVTLINLLSPDALLMSGGMCAQQAWFVNPLIEYIRHHGYGPAVDDRLLLGVAALGEDAPMIGAALLPGEQG